MRRRLAVPTVPLLRSVAAIPRSRGASMSDSLDFDPFDRMLLTADGTVTSLLEACTGEPIATRTTRQTGPPPSTGSSRSREAGGSPKRGSSSSRQSSRHSGATGTECRGHLRPTPPPRTHEPAQWRRRDRLTPRRRRWILARGDSNRLVTEGGRHETSSTRPCSRCRGRGRCDVHE